MVMEIVISLIILFMGIAVLVCIHFCIVGRAFGRDNSNNNQDRISEDTTQGQSNNTTMKGMSGDIGDLKNLPCFDYEEEEKGISSSLSLSLVDCAVCLESFKVGDACRLLPNCNHIFHVQCIDSWILKTPFCPICRTCVMIREETAVPVPVPVPDSVEIEMP